METTKGRQARIREDAVAKRLREMRKARNMSQFEVAQNIGVSRTAYLKYESGKGGIPGKTLFELADLFGTSTDYLLCRNAEGSETAREEAERTAYFEYSKARADLQSLINAMGEESIEVMLGIAKVVSERRIEPVKKNG